MQTTLTAPTRSVTLRSPEKPEITGAKPPTAKTAIESPFSHVAPSLTRSLWIVRSALATLAQAALARDLST
jgi:hypothetical protein